VLPHSGIELDDARDRVSWRTEFPAAKVYQNPVRRGRVSLPAKKFKDGPGIGTTQVQSWAFEPA